MVSRILAVLAALAAASAAILVPVATAEDPGDGDPFATPLSINVDADPEPESLRVRELRCGGEPETPPPCAADSVPTIQIDLVDTCKGAELVIPLLVRTETFATVMESVELDGKPGREFIVGAATGASGRNGQIIVGAVRARGDGCARVRRLVALGPSIPRTRKPRGSKYHATGGLIVRSLRRDFPGKEIVVYQPWYRSGDAGCCPSFESAAYLRYRPSTDTYVRYRSRIRRTAAGS